jgi:SAM-dependent methyltransferase
VIAIDVDPDAVRQLAMRFPTRQFPAVTVRAGTADDPGLAAGTIDAALLVDVYHELHDAAKMLAAIRRALRPGGHLVVVDRAASEYDPRQHAIPEARVTAEAAAAGFHLRARARVTRDASPARAPHAGVHAVVRTWNNADHIRARPFGPRPAANATCAIGAFRVSSARARGGRPRRRQRDHRARSPRQRRLT